MSSSTRLSGGLSFGPVGWPNPNALILRDRATGTDYLLSHDSADDEIVLLTPVPRLVQGLPREPLIWTPAGNRRLYVENGTLFAEYAPSFLQNILHGPVFTLNLSDKRTTYEIHGAGALTPIAALCVRKYSDLGLVTLITDLGCNILAVVFSPLYVDTGYVLAGYVESGDEEEAIGAEPLVYEAGVYEAGVYE